jgi:microcystin-dependent protein
MDDARISQLKVAAPLSGSEYIPITQLQESTNVLRTVYTNPDAFKDFVFGTSADSFCPTGLIVSYAGSVSSVDTPNGWLLCDGRSVLRSTYSKLFERIGTTYGSVNDKSFNLPNLKGRVVMGFCDTTSTTSLTGVSGANLTTDTIVSVGSVGGEFNHQLVASEVPLVQTPISIGTINPISRRLYSANSNGGSTVSMGSQVSGGLKALFGGTLPEYITFAYSFRQACGAVTNKGSWQSLGCSGNNAWASGSVTVSPDKNGDVYFKVSDQGWGYQTLNVTIYLPGASTSVAKGTNTASSLPFNVTQPYMVMNYIIKY